MKKYLYFLLFFSSLLSALEQQSFWETYTAALRGDKVAQFQTGVIYERGIGVEQNQTQASIWYEKSAWQGYVDAQYNLALMNLTGRGVDKNTDRAMVWLAKAAKQGDKDARTLLLEIIDGKHDESTKPKLTNQPVKISAIRLKTIKDSKICDHEGECILIKASTTLTSKLKNGSYYKVSGMGGKNGWEVYGKEGWIDEASVEIRR